MTVEQYFYKAASTVVVWHWEPFYVPCAAGYRYYPAAFSLFGIVPLTVNESFTPLMLPRSPTV